MEFPGIGGGRTGQAVKDVRSALEQAEAGPPGRRGARQPGDPAGPEHPRPRASTARGSSTPPPRSPTTPCARTATPRPPSTRSCASTSGSARRPASSPASAGSSRCRWRCRPTCWASTCIATRMTAAVAKVRGYDLRSGGDPHRGAADPRRAPTPTTCSRRPAWPSPGGTLSNLAAQRLPGPAMMVIQKGVGFRLLATAGKNMFVRLGQDRAHRRWCHRCRARRVHAAPRRRRAPSASSPRPAPAVAGARPCRRRPAEEAASGREGTGIGATRRSLRTPG